ncbi:MAG: hypothetical protein ACXWDO_02135 [Bacteroidia bacterium]
MKKYVFIFTIALMTMAASCKENTGTNETSADGSTKENQTEEENGNANYAFNQEKPYPYKTGIIEYKYTGDIQGTQTVYFKDYGRTLSVEEEYTNISAPTQPKVKQVFISTADKYYFIDMLTKTGYFSPKNDTSNKEQLNLLADVTTLGIDSAMRKSGYLPSGQVEISGKKCQVYKSEGGESEFCFWEGMNIRTEMTLGPNVKYKLEAVNIRENANIDDDKFTPPADVKLMDYNKYIKAQTKDKL